MAKSNAERQAAYRARRNERNNGDGEGLLNMLIKIQAKFALKRLANRYGVTEKAMIEKLLLDEDEKFVKTLAIDTEEWNNYFLLRSNDK